MPNSRIFASGRPLVCSGSGFVALDIVFSERSNIPKYWAGGSCGNVMTILSYFGWRSYPVARLGHDPSGERVLEDLRHWGVKTEFIERDSSISTPSVVEKIRVKSNPKHIFELRCPRCGRALPRRKSISIESAERVTQQIPKCHVFYFDRASKGILTMAKHHREAGALVIFEPPRFRQGDKLFDECVNTAHILKHCYNSSLEKNEKAKIPIEIQTMGEKGLRYRTSLFGSDEEWTTMPSFPVYDLVDTAGAGDWCTAGIVHVLGEEGVSKKLTREKLETALRLGQCLGAINCYFEGARGLMYSLQKKSLLAVIDMMMKDTFDGKHIIDKIKLKRTNDEKVLEPRFCTCR